MSWKFVNSMSITDRLLLIFLTSIVLILGLITLLMYPPLKSLLHHARMHHEYDHFLLTQICIKKFFIALWCSALVALAAAYFLAKKSISPIKQFSQELASISASSLDKRLPDAHYPKELNELASTCNHMLFRIEHAFQHMKQFSLSMAHELRNPLHYLRNATEITLAGPQTVDAYQQLLQTHLEEYNNLTVLIENLLFLTRSEQHQLALNYREQSAFELIDAVVDYYQATALDKNIDLQVTGDAVFSVDQQLFKRVIANLLDNSLTYTHSSGKVLITIEPHDHEVTIRIKDNGIGIDAQHISLLGQGFYRVNPSTLSTNAGIGLGLAIAQSIMENHKGRMTIESDLGVGTEVILSFPKE